LVVMERILVSACLLGSAVRYDGGAKRSDAALLWQWWKERRLVSVCPEVSGGLGVPRPPAEIADGAGGEAVLDGTGRILTDAGEDVTLPFVQGALAALTAAERAGARMAILKEGSPSCGSLRVYDGTFSGRAVAGMGVTAALLTRHGLRVFNEEQLEQAEQYLHELEDT
jgi:uncharacterized protein YbbK (DUF523 family)